MFLILHYIIEHLHMFCVLYLKFYVYMAPYAFEGSHSIGVHSTCSFTCVEVILCMMFSLRLTTHKTCTESSFLALWTSRFSEYMSVQDFRMCSMRQFQNIKHVIVLLRAWLGCLKSLWEGILWAQILYSCLFCLTVPAFSMLYILC